MLLLQVVVVGVIVFDECDQVIVQVCVIGYVEYLYVCVMLDLVVKGQLLVDLYVLDWIVVQEEFLLVWCMQGIDLVVLVDGVCQCMCQVGMNDVQIVLVECSGKMQLCIMLIVLVGGVVVELMV